MLAIVRDNDMLPHSRRNGCLPRAVLAVVSGVAGRAGLAGVHRHAQSAVHNGEAKACNVVVRGGIGAHQAEDPVTAVHRIGVHPRSSHDLRGTACTDMGSSEGRADSTVRGTEPKGEVAITYGSGGELGVSAVERIPGPSGEAGPALVGTQLAGLSTIDAHQRCSGVVLECAKDLVIDGYAESVAVRVRGIDGAFHEQRVTGGGGHSRNSDNGVLVQCATGSILVDNGICHIVI
mmetsp:Transcript_32281/g.57790  ORF Transcript_32281/g.57790 Transcript_32281/m.57790 type:complete len:234 (-) Transcript_32281:4513-5214(-)